MPDEVGAVAAEVQAASAACEMVITSGGVGPTLDDVTMAAVARAMGYPLARCDQHHTGILPTFDQSSETCLALVSAAPTQDPCMCHCT